MIKIIFPFQIKYKECYIPSNTAFEADDSDKKELLKMGGKIIGEEKIIQKGDKNESTKKA